MYREDLIEYLNGELSSTELIDKIQDELSSFKKSLVIIGGSASVIYIGDNEKTIISSTHLKRICNDYLINNVDEYFISYKVDALTLSENSEFETEDLKEIFETLTDFGVNGHLTKGYVYRISN
jgi:hypothetical protein